jgi:hypothetical protein
MVLESDRYDGGLLASTDHCQGSQRLARPNNAAGNYHYTAAIYHLNCGSDIIFRVPRTQLLTKKTRRSPIRTFLLCSFDN